MSIQGHKTDTFVVGSAVDAVTFADLTPRFSSNLLLGG